MLLTDPSPLRRMQAEKNLMPHIDLHNTESDISIN